MLYIYILVEGFLALLYVRNESFRSQVSYYARARTVVSRCGIRIKQ